MVLRLGLDYRPALLTSAGIGRSVRELSRALAEDTTLDLRLFGHSLSRARHQARIPGRARLHRLPIPGRSLPALARLGVDAGLLSGGVSVFHWTDYIHPPIRDARIVLTLHDLAFAEDQTFHGAGQSEVLLERCRRASEDADVIITPTHATAEAARRHLRIHDDRLRVVRFGCDHVPDSADLGQHPMGGRPYVLSLGTIEPRKNHQRLLSAWRELPRRPGLVIIGKPGWECEDTIEDIQEAVRQQGAIWLQQLPDREMFRYLAHAQALAYPSHLEGFGFPPLEAMALGTPVLAGDTPALREVLGEAALFCDTHSREDIAQKLQYLVEDPAVVASLRARGRQRARLYSWQACARDHAEIYREVIL